MRILILVSLSLSLLLPAVAWADATVSATGRVVCHENGREYALPYVRVDLMDSDTDYDTLSDDEMGHAHTDANGYFHVTGYGGDSPGLIGANPDVYISVVFSDRTYRQSLGDVTRVRLTDELDRDRRNDTSRHDHDNTSGGTVNFGVVKIGVGQQVSQCALWKKAFEVYQDYVSRMGEQPPAGKVDVELWTGINTGTPWSNLDTVHWPTNWTDYGSMRHEFGHTVRHSFDGDGNHFTWDVTRFAYARYHDACLVSNQGFAFNEGWADFYAGDTAGCWWGNPMLENWENEGEVAKALRKIDTTCQISLADMTRVLANHPGEIHSFPQYYAKLRLAHPDCDAGFASLPVEKFNPHLVGGRGVFANQDGRLEVHAVAHGGEISHIWQHTPSGSWSGWAGSGGWTRSIPAVTRNHDGRQEVFVVGYDGAVWHRWQLVPNGGWSGWTSLGNSVTGIAAAYDTTGRMDVVAVGTDNALWRIRQSEPSHAFTSWQKVGGLVKGTPTIAMNKDGRLEVMAVGTDGTLRSWWQTGIGSGYVGNHSFGGWAQGTPFLSRNADGRLEVFVLGADNGVWHLWQTTPNGGWSGWYTLGGNFVGNVAVGVNADGRMQVFARGADSSIYTTGQTAVNHAFAAWTNLGGFLPSNPQIGRNADGTLEVFAVGGDAILWHRRQASPNSGLFYGWSSVGGNVDANYF